MNPEPQPQDQDKANKEIQPFLRPNLKHGSALRRWVLLQRRKKMADCKSATPLLEQPPPPKPKQPKQLKRKDNPPDKLTLIAKLKVLQRQFEARADEFPELSHVAIQVSKDGMYPPIHIGLDTTSSKFHHLYWFRDEKMSRDADEVGYPTKHWLHFFDGGKYDVETIIKIVHKFDNLAWDAGGIVAKMDSNVLPVSKTKLWVKTGVEYWILMLHHFNNPRWFTLYYPDNGRTILSGDRPQQREAEEGDHCFCWLENLFLKSAELCEVLLAKLAGEQKETGSVARQKDIMSKSARALAVLKDHPDWTNKKIAEVAGYKSDKSLYRNKDFRKAREILKEGKSNIPNGSKNTETGEIEAW